MKGNKSVKAKLTLTLCLIISLLFLSGCWGKREVEDLAPLLGIGIDLGKKPGTFLLTNQFAQPQKEKGGGSQINDRTFTVETASVREAFEEVSKLTDQTPFMGSLKVIVIGEEAAKAGGFNDVLDFAQRFSEFRRSMYLVLARGKAQDLLNLKLGAGVLPALYIEDLIEGGEELSSFPTVRLGHYLTVLGTKSTAPVLPVVEKVKNGEGIEYKGEGQSETEEIRIQGMGVLKGDKLVDFLTDEETKGYMWLEDDVVNRPITSVCLADNSVKFGGQVLKANTKYKVKKDSGKVELHYQIKADIAIDEVLGLRQELSGEEWVKLIKEGEKSFAQVIKNECEASIKKQRELGLDYLGIGRHIEQKNLRYWKTVKDHWQDEIADFPVSIEVETVVHHSGMSSSSATNS